MSLNGEAWEPWYILVQDEDGHWYVIPEDKRDDFEEYVMLASNWMYSDEDVEPPEEPSWVVRVGGAPSLVVFPSWEFR